MQLKITMRPEAVIESWVKLAGRAVCTDQIGKPLAKVGKKQGLAGTCRTHNVCLHRQVSRACGGAVEDFLNRIAWGLSVKFGTMHP